MILNGTFHLNLITGSCMKEALADNPTKISSPKPAPPPQTIPQSLFDHTTVYVQISDEKTRDIVKSALPQIGATVLNEASIISDIIIADQQITLKSPTRNNTRGLRMLTTVREIPKQPRVIQLKQIPWIFDIHPPIIEPVEESEDEEERMIVVADIDSRFRPNFKLITNELLTLNYEKVPKWYFFSPFDIIPENVEEQYSRAKRCFKSRPILTQPADGGICDICNNKYESASLHRVSTDHQYHVLNADWSDLDSFAEELNSKFVQLIQ